MKKYAEIAWSPEDIKSLRPEWSIEQCTDWLSSNDWSIQERLVEQGWNLIDSLLPAEVMK